MKALFLEMLQIQHELNTAIHPEWREQNFAWGTALWTECAELQESLPWKWWKSTDTDWDNVRIETVDIWHFGLSLLMQQHGTSDEDLERVAQALHENYKLYLDNKDDITAWGANEHIARGALNNKFSFGFFFALADAADMSMELVRGIYTGKAALNAFRQMNGYKDGTYQKEWEGREDNEHLTDLLGAHSPVDPELYENILRDLADRYSQVTGGDAYIQPVRQDSIPELAQAHSEGSEAPDEDDDTSSGESPCPDCGVLELPHEETCQFYIKPEVLEKEYNSDDKIDKEEIDWD